MRQGSGFVVAAGLLCGVVSGCLDRTPIVPGQDTPGFDSGLDAPVPDVPGLDAPDVPMDTPSPDVPGLDAPDTPVIDTGVDAPPIDTGVDAAPIDTGVDAPPIDTGVDAPTPPTCDELFGGLSMTYAYCTETATTCTFYVNNGMSCSSTCSAVAGSTCFAATWTPGDCSGGAVTCGSSSGRDRVCTCTRP
jgi:hypothetical protein